METFDLKRGLFLGTSIGGVASDGVFPGHPWEDWCRRNRPREELPFRSADHWDRWHEDAELMHGMGLECCRFVLDWAHIEPEQGCFDDAAIAHVREEILYLRAMGIRVTLVLHEFSDPVWFARLGGWSKAANIGLFLNYVEKILRTVGHLVEDYVPMSQPNLFAWNGWYSGAWMPGKKSMLGVRQTMGVLALTHIESYRRIHELRNELGLRDTRVGASVYMRMMRPAKKKAPLLSAGADTLERLFQSAMGEAMVCGKFSVVISNLGHVAKGSYCDFHDLCCYAVPVPMEVPGAGREPETDELLYCAAERSAMLRRPICITEGSGLSAPSPRRIYDCVRALSAAGLPVERYFTLSFADGFGFGKGGETKLGIVTTVDNGKRKIRPAGEFLTRMIRNRGVTEDMCRDYADTKM